MKKNLMSAVGFDLLRRSSCGLSMSSMSIIEGSRCESKAEGLCGSGVFSFFDLGAEEEVSVSVDVVVEMVTMLLRESPFSTAEPLERFSETRVNDKP